MATDIDYQPVIADLVRRRDELSRTIVGLCAIAGIPVPDSPPPGGNGGTGAQADALRELRSDSFFNMKAPEAIKTYLSMAKRPKTVKEIQDALESGGFTTSAKDFYNNLYTAITRMEKDGIVVKVHGKWGLAEWYPSRPKAKPKADATGADKEEVPSTDDPDAETAA